ncbi:protein translocase subunit SecDF [Solitalea koreensis]|uniref:Multifunctional fusion protein n=1 Tax=Solitalea koreensis TaxID=543615 RepID=A0A521D842_9SPHI|nr:protein translocase subunit SecDF [Solitalea koreensis]SMO67854.1 SecD/SecF fusion protein [Solitalea koreensis]
MQGKGAIRFVAIALALACLYHISFTWVVSKVEKNAKEYAHGDPAKERIYLDSIATEPVYNLGFAKFTYKDCKEKQLNLGLDLKGGMNVTMEISLADLIRSMSGNSTDANFNKALNLAKERSATSQKDFVTLFGQAYKEVAPNGRLAEIFATQENKDRINFNSSNEDVLKVLTKESASAFDRSFNILRTRIDKFGVTQPNIQKIGNGRILIELPGVDDPERVRKLLQGSAKLEFWETYDNQEVFGAIDAANKVIAARLALTEKTAPAVAKTEIAKDTTKKSELALLNKMKSDSGKKDTSAAQTMLAKQNPLFAVLIPNTVQGQNGQQMLGRGSVVGYAALKDTAKVNEYLAMPEVRANFPTNLRLVWSVKAINDKNIFALHALKASGRDGKAALGGDVISNARADFSQDGKPEVVMNMNADGAKAWRRITAEAAAANNRAVAIVLDDAVYTAPNVQNEISGGVSSISGNFKPEETQDMANILKAGKLPAPAKIIQESTVGPTLGVEAINSGLLSCLAGLVVILIFMAIYYNNAGITADIALIVSLFFMIGVLASFGAVLTLPGIAGIVLNIGMAVDANVLIYERIKEELDHGKSLRMAISDGFKHAYSAIIDANVTILLLGIILYVFSSGLVQGFATTLVIGIFTSLFCAIFITRLIFEAQLAKNKLIKFQHNFSRNWFKDVNYDFVAKRKIFYAISGLIILAGAISIVTKGFDLGVDFKGGRTYIVQFDKGVKVADVSKALAPSFDNEAPTVQTLGGSSQVKITTAYKIEDQSNGIDKFVDGKLHEGLSKMNGIKGHVVATEIVGPTIANDMRNSSIIAIVLGILVVFVYIVIRFRRWQFGIGAVVALAHDVLVLLALFSLLRGILPFSLDIDQAFVAAILTVMGYSMNDTVVVFDRVREYMGTHYAKNQSLSDVINKALNSTLNRTMVTGLCTMLVLIVLFIFGGATLRGFSFALLVGVVFGTYSSLFVATPIVVDMISKDDHLLADKKDAVLVK